MSEKPTCERCGQRHWFLDPCGTEGTLVIPVADVLGGATRAEVEKALAHYRAYLKRQRDGMRRRRAHKG